MWKHKLIKRRSEVNSREQSSSTLSVLRDASAGRRKFYGSFIYLVEVPLTSQLRKSYSRKYQVGRGCAVHTSIYSPELKQSSLSWAFRAIQKCLSFLLAEFNRVAKERFPLYQEVENHLQKVSKPCLWHGRTPRFLQELGLEFCLSPAVKHLTMPLSTCHFLLCLTTPHSSS